MTCLKHMSQIRCFYHDNQGFRYFTVWSSSTAPSKPNSSATYNRPQFRIPRQSIKVRHIHTPPKRPLNALNKSKWSSLCFTLAGSVPIDYSRARVCPRSITPTITLARVRTIIRCGVWCCVRRHDCQLGKHVWRYESTSPEDLAWNMDARSV